MIKGLTKTIEELIVECKNEVESCGFKLPYIKYEYKTNITHYLGICHRKGAEYTIELSIPHMIRYFERNEIDKIKDTILHEMCHALPKGMTHKGQWKVYTNTLNKKYGYDIKTSADDDEVIEELNKIKAKYTVVCEECGYTYYYSRRPKILNTLNTCKCGNCHTKGKLILK